MLIKSITDEIRSAWFRSKTPSHCTDSQITVILRTVEGFYDVVLKTDFQKKEVVEIGSSGKRKVGYLPKCNLMLIVDEEAVQDMVTKISSILDEVLRGHVKIIGDVRLFMSIFGD